MVMKSRESKKTKIELGRYLNAKRAKVYPSRYKICQFIRKSSKIFTKSVNIISFEQPI